MADKINSFNAPINSANVNKATAGTKGSQSNPNVEATRSEASSNVAQVDIASAQTLEKIRESLASQPIVDRQKVETVKQALQDGTYKINSENIANKLIEFEKLIK